MRCTLRLRLSASGSLTDESRACCNYFDVNDTCVEACPANSSPNAEFSCVCDLGYFAPDGTCIRINECELKLLLAIATTLIKMIHVFVTFKSTPPHSTFI